MSTQQLRLAVDTWAPSFGTAVSGAMTEPTGPVDISPEVAAADWAPRDPHADTLPCEDVRFIDGVRRIDARVWAIDDGDAPPRAAIAVSYAAGAVRCNGRADLEDVEVKRCVFGPAGMPPLEAAGATYLPHATAGASDEDLIGEVQKQLGELEKQLAARLEPTELTIVDGPLSGRQHIKGAVGYIKTHQVEYLPPTVHHVIANLAPHQRTPLFLTQTNYSRYSWYLRLPYGAGHPWAGVVRLEASADLPLPRAIELADLTTATLPKFASRPHRDPRAPQNLYPIGGLEARLKRRLGDPAYLERALRKAAASL